MDSQLDRIERKINFLIVNLGGMENFGEQYRGMNGLSAYERIIESASEGYLKNKK